MKIYIVIYASTYGGELYTEFHHFENREHADAAFKEYSENAAFDEFGEDFANVEEYVAERTVEYRGGARKCFHMMEADYEVEVTFKEIIIGQ